VGTFLNKVIEEKGKIIKRKIKSGNSEKNKRSLDGQKKKRKGHVRTSGASAYLSAIGTSHLTWARYEHGPPDKLAGSGDRFNAGLRIAATEASAATLSSDLIS
jgi:hypothetical protein